MSTDRDLSELVSEVEARVAELALPTFPAVPLAGEASAIAVWPDEDVTGFLELVSVLKPPLLYMEAASVQRSAVADLEAAADERKGELDDGDDHADDQDGEDDERFEFDPFTEEYVGRDRAAAQVEQWRSAAAAAVPHVGEVGRLQIAFAAGGVLHEWSRGTDWYDEFELAQTDVISTRRRRRLSPRPDGGWRAERAEKEEEAQRLYAELEPTVKAWVAQLLGSRKFVGGASREVRFAVAGDLIPELDEWRSRQQLDLFSDPQGWARYRAARDAVGEADEKLQSLKDQRAAELRGRASEVAAELVNDSEFRSLRTKDEQRRHIHSLVEDRLWFRSADVTDRILAVARDLISSGAPGDAKRSRNG
ncbi:MAG TPA: hypothetical protein VHB69_15440 [Mycobacteriales bacterium]|nr:hypothetical protein [Mycobacteriales bacterium]